MGYKPVDDGVVCVDVDECVDRPDLCSHYCNNTQGSFECSCSDGYVLEPDGRSCKITGIQITSKCKYIFSVCKTYAIFRMACIRSSIHSVFYKNGQTVCIMQQMLVCYILSMVVFYMLSKKLRYLVFQLYV